MDNSSHLEILNQVSQNQESDSKFVRLRESWGKVVISLPVSELWRCFCNIIKSFSVIVKAIHFTYILSILCYEVKPEAETLRQIPNILLVVKNLD